MNPPSTSALPISPGTSPFLARITRARDPQLFDAARCSWRATTPPGISLMGTGWSDSTPAWHGLNVMTSHGKPAAAACGKCPAIVLHDNPTEQIFCVRLYRTIRGELRAVAAIWGNYREGDTPPSPGDALAFLRSAALAAEDVLGEVQGVRPHPHSSTPMN